MRPYRPDILVVEDDRGVAELIKNYVNLYSSMSIHTSYSGEDAIAALQQFKPRSIILDIHLPGISSLEVLDYIEAMKWNIPVVIITADPKEDIRAIAISSKLVIDYFTKPDDVGNMEVMLYRLVLNIIKGLLRESMETLNCTGCPYRKSLANLHKKEEGAKNDESNGREHNSGHANTRLSRFREWAYQFVRSSDIGHESQQV